MMIVGYIVTRLIYRSASLCNGRGHVRREESSVSGIGRLS